MSPPLVNLRVTTNCSQGGRKYMEDFVSVAYKVSPDKLSADLKNLEFAFFGIFDGHGGKEAAVYAKNHLMKSIIRNKLFWSDSDSDVLRAIREGYIITHCAMWRQQDKWPRTANGLPSTAGTTATIAFIRGGKIYIGHVGDSGLVLGYQEEGVKSWSAKSLTKDHKPESSLEKARIINSGGKVITKSGVPRVVWNRPRVGHKGPVRRSTHIDEIPFLAVARSLGDLWSYNSLLNEFVVSPEPDVSVVEIRPETFRCLIFGTDGLWNVVSAQDSVYLVRWYDEENEGIAHTTGHTREWTNPSKGLVDTALERCNLRKMRADNTSVITIMIDPNNESNRLKTCGSNCFGIGHIQIDADSPTFCKILNSKELEETSSHFHDTNIDYYNHKQNYGSIPREGYNIAEGSHAASQDPHAGRGSTPTITNLVNIVQRHDVNYEYYDSHNTVSNTESINSSIESPCNTSNLAHTSLHQNDLSYVNNHSFVESYNSLITNLENENSSSSSSSDSSGDEDNYGSRLIYKSLNETGLAGHDHIYQHLPNRNNEQMLACMLNEDGYSLTRLETRCEQNLRNNSNSVLNNNKKNQNYLTFHSFGEASTSHYNKSDSISYSQPEDMHINQSSLPSNEAHSSINSNALNLTAGESIRRILDEKVQINEISSSVNETSTFNCKKTRDVEMEDLSLRDDARRKNMAHYENLTTLRMRQSSFPDRQNENMSTSNDRPSCITKRTLRSQSSLPKEIKIKVISKKHQSRQLKRSMCTKEFLKIENSPASICKIRTRQQQHQQQEQIIFQTRPKKISINKANTQKSALSANTNLNKSIPINNNVNIRNSAISNKNNRFNNPNLLSPPITRSASLSSNIPKPTSSCLAGKHVVQKKNRVQKR